MEVALWGRIWIRLSSGDPSSSTINALKFFVFTLNGFKETAKAALWLPGARVPGRLRLLKRRRQRVWHLGAKPENLCVCWRTWTKLEGGRYFW